MKIITRNAAKRLLVSLGILGGLGLISFLTASPTKEQWLRQQAKVLSRVKITDAMIAAAQPWQPPSGEPTALGIPQQERPGEWTYILQRNYGVIPIGADDGVYVVTHSFHDNESKFLLLLSLPAALILHRYPPVSDATIVVDRQGRLYTCEGHICGGLMLTSKKEVKTLQDFLETYAYSDEKNTWKPYSK